jgi:hypothetical protein
MRVVVKPTAVKHGKPFYDARTGNALDEADIIELITRKIRQRLAALEDPDDKLVIEILLDYRDNS